jgi:CMP-N,N'-diacetyllegionaminic acid synthase
VNLRFLAFIPARGGSKGIVGKNIIDLAGKPLIAWTIEAAQQSNHVLDIFVSTDDEAIADVAAHYCAANQYRRPAELASDTATTVDAVADALDWLASQGKHYDAIVLLQPTSPLRSAQHINEAIEQWLTAPSQPLVSVCEPAHPPYLLFAEQANGSWQRLAPVPVSGRRQDASLRSAQINGAIYIQSVARFNQQRLFFEEDHTQFYFMPIAASVDIDTPVDLALARALLSSH